MNVKIWQDEYAELLESLADDVELSAVSNIRHYAKLLKAGRLNAEQTKRMRQLAIRTQSLIVSLIDFNNDYDIPDE